MAILLALVAAVIALRPASATRTYGFHRATILAALANGLVLIAVTGTITALSIERLLHPREVHGGVVIVAAAASLIANVAVVWLLVEGHRDLSIRSALVHAIGDALSAVVVALSGVIALVASGPLAERADPAASLIVAGVIVIEAFKITWSSLNILLEGTPPDIDLSQVRAALGALPDVSGVHDLHVWSLSSAHRALSAHLVVDGDPTLSAAGTLLADVRSMLVDAFNIDHATVELESAECDEHPGHP